MKKKIIAGVAIFSSILMVSCAKQTPAAPTESTTTTKQTHVVTTQNTQAATEATEATEAATAQLIPEGAKQYTGTFTELMNSPKSNMSVELNKDTFNAKLNIANDVSAKTVPIGEYSASFKYSEIKDNGDNTYTVTTKAKGNNKDYDATITFYGQDGSIDGVTLNINQDSIELLSGSPL